VRGTKKNLPVETKAPRVSIIEVSLGEKLRREMKGGDGYALRRNTGKATALVLEGCASGSGRLASMRRSPTVGPNTTTK
jgi:hypothetical protein